MAPLEAWALSGENDVAERAGVGVRVGDGLGGTAWCIHSRNLARLPSDRKSAPRKKRAEEQRCGYNDRNVLSAPGARTASPEFPSAPRNHDLRACPKPSPKVPRDPTLSPERPENTTRVPLTVLSPYRSLANDGHQERGRTGAERSKLIPLQESLVVKAVRVRVKIKVDICGRRRQIRHSNASGWKRRISIRGTRPTNRIDMNGQMIIRDISDRSLITNSCVTYRHIARGAGGAANVAPRVGSCTHDRQRAHRMRAVRVGKRACRIQWRHARISTNQQEREEK